ncbi:MAG: phosphoribosylformylglycinamidine cyclo-ligase, partial [Mogibacterium diversum]|nr:phosphoribosylformylglycinamidine cyclo-ligase [Mogibacterium diversum]
MKSQSESYKEAGVDITSGYRAVELMKEHVGKTMKFGNTAPVGGFGGLLQPDLTG